MHQKREFKSFLRNRVAPDLSCGGYARHSQVEDRLEHQEHPIDRPCLQGRECSSVNQMEHVLSKLTPGHIWFRGKFSVVVSRADPHVPHQQWKADHHRADTPTTAEVEMWVEVDPGI